MNISRYLDHAVLKPNLTEQEVRDAIQAGIDHQVYSVCVRPCDIDLAREMCEGTDTLVTCVLASPMETVRRRARPLWRSCTQQRAWRKSTW